MGDRGYPIAVVSEFDDDALPENILGPSSSSTWWSGRRCGLEPQWAVKGPLGPAAACRASLRPGRGRQDLNLSSNPLLPKRVTRVERVHTVPTRAVQTAHAGSIWRIDLSAELAAAA